MVRKSLLAALAVSALALTGCTTRQVVENTGDAVVGGTKLVVRGAVGATKLAARGTVAGVRRLQEPRGRYPAGTQVCLNDQGEVLGRIEVVNGQTVCVAEAEDL